MLSGMGWLLYALCLALVLYAAVVAAFLVAGRREEARAVAGFVPDCVVLFSRLLRDERLPRRHKLLEEHWPGPRRTLAWLEGFYGVFTNRR